MGRSFPTPFQLSLGIKLNFFSILQKKPLILLYMLKIEITFFLCTLKNKRHRKKTLTSASYNLDSRRTNIHLKASTWNWLQQPSSRTNQKLASTQHGIWVVRVTENYPSWKITPRGKLPQAKNYPQYKLPPVRLGLFRLGYVRFTLVWIG